MNEEEKLIALLSARAELETAHLKDLREIDFARNEPDYHKKLTRAFEEHDYVRRELDKRIKTLMNKLNSKEEA